MWTTILCTTAIFVYQGVRPCDTGKSLQPQDAASMSALIESQQRQIEKLEKQLKYSQDKVLALNTLIDVIEEQGIKVRKKAGVKQ